jgi:hypothetical protein
MSFVPSHWKSHGRRGSALLAVALMLVMGTGCGDEGPDGPFRLTFELDASYHTPHQNQMVWVAVVDPSDGSVIARESGTVSATADPAFSYTTSAVLQAGNEYEVHYWIDSNFSAGTLGVCDPPANDHQWNVAVPAVSADVTLSESHDPQSIDEVCATFTADLTFAGDATYQTPHGDDPISVAVVRASDVQIVATESGTVSGEDDPAFSFDFPGLLVIGVEYQIHYWIDSNFGDGTLGTCDPPANDHQWNIAVPAVEADVDILEDHDATSTSDVCSTFD